MISEQYFFHPDYDGHVHVDFSKTAPVGVEFIGPMGLLNRLELKLCLTHAETPDYLREKEYQIAIENVKNSLTVFKESFALDPIHVSKQLLAWRDALVMAGWDGTCNNGVSDLIKDLSAIETNFNKSIPGIADRWIEVKNSALSLKGKISITACCDKNQIHPTIASILDILGATFASLQSVFPKITAYKFVDVYDAYLTAAVKLDPQNDVVVCQNSKAFNDVLKLVGHNSIESTLDNVNSQILQLFKIQLLLFAEPNNFRNLISYLTTRPCPIEDGGLLGNYLLKNCGWGDAKTWNDFLSENANNKQTFEKFRSFIDSIKDTTQGNVIKDHIECLYSVTKKYNSNAIVRSQLQTVRDYCHKLLSIIDEKKNYTANEIRLLADRIFSPASYAIDDATTDSFFTYKSLGCLYGSAERVVWIDCYGELIADYNYDFITAVDAQNLNLSIWKNTDQVAAKVALLSAATNHAGKEVVLFVPQNAQGERVKQSPLLTDLNVKPKDVAGSPFELSTTTQSIVPFASQSNSLYYDIPNTVVVNPRNNESYSSLSLLIDYPFDYVFKYACGLYAPEIDQLDGLDRIMGTVAHKVLEHLYNDCGSYYTKMQQIVNSDLEVKITDAAKQCGIMLLLPENKFVFEKLKSDLTKSFTNLISILQKNDLEIVGTEKNYEVSNFFGTGNNLTAQIDLVLKDKEDKILIFDLKYGKPSYYQNLLESNTALQLDIYKHCVENDTSGNKATVRMVGYFNLKEGKLFTHDTSLNVDDNIVVVELSKDALTGSVIDLVKNSYNYRFEEFNSNHKLEEAEGLLAKDKAKRGSYPAQQTQIDYCRAIIDATHNLYPMKMDDLGNKKENIYSDYKLFKGESK